MRCAMKRLRERQGVVREARSRSSVLLRSVAARARRSRPRCLNARNFIVHARFCECTDATRNGSCEVLKESMPLGMGCALRGYTYTYIHHHTVYCALCVCSCVVVCANQVLILTAEQPTQDGAEPAPEELEAAAVFGGDTATAASKLLSTHSEATSTPCRPAIAELALIPVEQPFARRVSQMVAILNLDGGETRSSQAALGGCHKRRSNASALELRRDGQYAPVTNTWTCPRHMQRRRTTSCDTAVPHGSDMQHTVGPGACIPRLKSVANGGCIDSTVAVGSVHQAGNCVVMCERRFVADAHFDALALVRGHRARRRAARRAAGYAPAQRRLCGAAPRQALKFANQRDCYNPTGPQSRWLPLRHAQGRLPT